MRPRSRDDGCLRRPISRNAPSPICISRKSPSPISWRPASRQGPSPTPWRPSSRWDDRHHVADSKDNHNLLGAQRCLFDNLSGLRVRGGVYVDTCISHEAKIFDTSSSCCADEILRRAQVRVERCPVFPEAWAAKATVRAVAIRNATEADAKRREQRITQQLHMQQQLLTGCGSAQDAEVRAPRAKNPKKVARKHLDSIIAFAEVPGQEPFLRFLQWVKLKFAQHHRVWRLLDKDESMVISKAELKPDLRRLGYKPNSKELEALFSNLDRDTSGVIRFLHFDPITAGALATIRHWCIVRGGGVQQVAASFDKDRSGNISLEEFEQGCRSSGFTQDEPLQLLFLFMGVGRQEQLTPSSLAFLDRWDAPEFLWAETDPYGAQQFKAFLFEKHKQNPIRAWRKSVDKDSSMRVCWMEFKKIVLQMRERHPKEFGGVSVAGVWRELDPMLSGWITLRDFDMDGYNVLAAFASWAKREHGSVSRSYKAFLPGGAAQEKGLGRGKMEKLLCGPLGLSPDDIDLLFEGLNLEEGDRVTLNELKFLENWDPVTEAEERKSWAKHFGPKLRQFSAAMHEHARDGAACAEVIPNEYPSP